MVVEGGDFHMNYLNENEVFFIRALKDIVPARSSFNIANFIEQTQLYKNESNEENSYKYSETVDLIEDYLHKQYIEVTLKNGLSISSIYKAKKSQLERKIAASKVAGSSTRTDYGKLRANLKNLQQKIEYYESKDEVMLIEDIKEVFKEYNYIGGKGISITITPGENFEELIRNFEEYLKKFSNNELIPQNNNDANLESFEEQNKYFQSILANQIFIHRQSIKTVTITPQAPVEERNRIMKTKSLYQRWGKYKLLECLYWNEQEGKIQILQQNISTTPKLLTINATALETDLQDSYANDEKSRLQSMISDKLLKPKTVAEPLEEIEVVYTQACIDEARKLLMVINYNYSPTFEQQKKFLALHYSGNKTWQIQWGQNTIYTKTAIKNSYEVNKQFYDYSQNDNYKYFASALNSAFDYGNGTIDIFLFNYGIKEVISYLVDQKLVEAMPPFSKNTSFIKRPFNNLSNFAISIFSYGRLNTSHVIPGNKGTFETSFNIDTDLYIVKPNWENIKKFLNTETMTSMNIKEVDPEGKELVPTSNIITLGNDSNLGIFMKIFDGENKAIVYNENKVRITEFNTKNKDYKIFHKLFTSYPNSLKPEDLYFAYGISTKPDKVDELHTKIRGNINKINSKLAESELKISTTAPYDLILNS